MGLKVEKGTLTAPTGTGNQTYTLADSGFGTVKALFLWAAYNTADGDVDGDGIFSMGFGTYRGSTAQQYCVNSFDDDGVTATVGAIGANTNAILHAQNAAGPTVDYDAALVSLGDHQFVLNWTDFPTSQIIVHYLALGGADISDALVTTFNLTTSAGTQDVTIASGFGLPDLLMSISTRGSTTLGDTTASPFLGFGVAIDDSNEAHSAMVSNGGAANMTLGSDQDSTFMVRLTNATTVGYEIEMSAKAAWPTDGFQVNKLTAPSATGTVGYLALKGTFAKAIGSQTAPTAAPTVTQDLNLGAGTTPRGAIFFHNSIAANAGIDTNHADLGTFGIGATDGTNQGWAGVGQDDGNGTSIAHRNHSTSKTVKMYTPSAAGTLASEATASIVTTNIRLTWADTDTIAREYRYLLLGDGAGTVPKNPAVNFQDPAIF